MDGNEGRIGPLRGMACVSHVSSKIPSRLRDSFKALDSLRLAYKEFENCPARATKWEVAAMRSPVFGKRGQPLHAFGIVRVILLRDIVRKVE
jgi:hypothetical protein